MGANSDKPQRWKADIKQSVDFYNDWFVRFAPKAFRETRLETTKQVESAMGLTANLTRVTAAVLKEHPEVLSMLRMATAPPLARDRLAGLTGVSRALIKSMEVDGRTPPRMAKSALDSELAKIGAMLARLADIDILPWLQRRRRPQKDDVVRAATIIADRLCGAQTDPIIRNAQEKRQLAAIRSWLRARKYRPAKTPATYDGLKPGTFAFHMNVPVKLDEVTNVNVSVDVAIMLHKAKAGHLPLFVEAKSAGDFTNVNKRRKEEAQKINQLRSTYGDTVRYVLFLCGFFDSGYLGYEAAEGIDWVWEHRIDDFSHFGL